jgi:hypothetical protein
MNFDAHRAALRAAAKVAFGVAILGCGGSGAPAGEESAEPEATSGGGESYDTAQADLRKRRPSPKPTTQCDSGTTSCASLTDTTAKEACCDGLLKTAFPAGNNPTTGVTEASAEVTACCQVVAEKVDRHWGDPNVDAGVFTWPRTQCCSLLKWGGSMACTPWGPPTPPPAHWRARKIGQEPAEVAA